MAVTNDLHGSRPRFDALGVVGRIVRLLFPADAERHLLREMKAAGVFDRKFYSATYPLPWFLGAFPMRHFAVYGEALGWKPNSTFDPKGYLTANPDVAAERLSPLLHWLLAGRAEGRRISPAKSPEEPTSKYRPFHPTAFTDPEPLAVVVHVYYTEVWDEISEVLQRFDRSFDLFVTVVDRGDASQRLCAHIKTEWPNVQIHIIQNKGRDILPFLTFVNAGVLDRYNAVCKLHTKRSFHRLDGDRWRRRLISGLFPSDASERLDRFLQDRSAGLWVADHQIYSAPRWWGENKDNVSRLLSRLEIKLGPLGFPAGSMYWIKPFLIKALRALNLSHHDFQPEAGQLDGTTAHSVERCIGQLTRTAGLKMHETRDLERGRKPASRPKPKYVSAFYLPQFHPIPENDVWWGKGFTEWRNVSKAEPSYTGHAHPYLPGDLGFYDLRQPDVMARQADLAKEAGIDGFCVYFYWFDRQRLLAEPIENLLQTPDVNFPFYLCWANESWRRNWDGASGELLIGQDYAEGFERRLAEDTSRCFLDYRYQRPDGKRPRFVIYRPTDLPDPHTNIARLRAAWRAQGVGEVELGAVRTFLGSETDSLAALFDFVVEMPPHGMVEKDDLVGHTTQGLRSGFSGLIYSYDRLVAKSCSDTYRSELPRNTIRGVMPSWDNTARRGLSAHVAYGANPCSFRGWLSELSKSDWQDSYNNELFINAWNEWGEKAVMEPSLQFGHAYLDALRDFTR